MPDNILVVAAHPDDEILGCGATLAKHVSGGDRVDVVIVAEGHTSRKDSETGDSGVDDLSKAAQAAAAHLGFNGVRLLGFPDNRLDTVALLEIVQAIEAIIEEMDPVTLYTHHGGDLNIDHQIVFRSILTACRPNANQSLKRILCYETPSSSEWSAPAVGPVFVPNHFVDVENFLDAKMEALEFYSSEIRAAPHPRSPGMIKALAAWRGAQSGATYAEAFEVCRQLA